MRGIAPNLPWRALCLVVFLVISVITIHPVFAQADNPPRTVTDNEVNEVAKELYCPVCENIPLDVCPTQACAEWRELIREKLAVGWSKQQVKQYFADQYGDRVLGAPPARGLNWLAYLIPPMVIALGVYILYRAFRSWRQIKPVAGGVAPIANVPGAPQDEYIRRLEEELKKK